MKIFPRHFAKLFTTPVMIHAGVRHQLESALLARMGLSIPSTPSIESAPPAPMAAVQGDDESAYRVGRLLEKFGTTAVVHMDGVIDKHISSFEMQCYGGFDIADFDAALADVAADDAIERVVLNINSPGGSVSGVPESAARVAALAQAKEVHAFVDVMACSAAYYIASQADVIAAAPSAILGSIGVYLTILDATRAAEMDGLKVELITAGKYKAM